MKKSIMLTVAVITFSLVGIFLGQGYIKPSSAREESIWNIYLDNMKASIINGNVFVPASPELENTTIKAYDVLVSKRGDYATFTFDVVNAGNIDANLSTLIKVEPKCISLELPAIESDEELVCNNLEYKVYYTNNNKEVNISDTIKAHTKENITIKVGLNENISEDPKSDVQVTLFDMTLVYN